jgi:hypothetical protein
MYKTYKGTEEATLWSTENMETIEWRFSLILVSEVGIIEENTIVKFIFVSFFNFTLS